MIIQYLNAFRARSIERCRALHEGLARVSAVWVFAAVVQALTL